VITKPLIRAFPKNLNTHWQDPRGLIQVFLGPRQVGKTTAATALANPDSTVFFSADAPAPPSLSRIEEQWIQARELESSERTLVLDEIQKIPGWSEVVKKMWDEDRRQNRQLRVAVLGSSALLIEKGLSESLTGRYETNFFPHWTLGEVRRLASVSVDTYLQLGGYPKAYDFGDDVERARSYIETGILEPTLGRDILALHAVDKPALLRQLFWYVSRLPAQIVSFQKILGALQDRGNSATIAHYAELLRLAFLVVPIYKFTRAEHRTKRSLPKWILPNPALVAVGRETPESRGFLIENLVGAHLLNITYGMSRYQLHYWREDNAEIDFVISYDGEPIHALEIKSNRKRKAPSAALLKKAGLSCPSGVVNESNLEAALCGNSIDEVIAISMDPSLGNALFQARL